MFKNVVSIARIVVRIQKLTTRGIIFTYFEKIYGLINPLKMLGTFIKPNYKQNWFSNLMDYKITDLKFYYDAGNVMT